MEEKSMKLTLKQLKQLVIECILAEELGASQNYAPTAGQPADLPDPQAVIDAAHDEIKQASAARANASQALVGQALSAMSRALVYAGASQEDASMMLTTLNDQFQKMISKAQESGHEALDTNVEAGGFEE
tara:strand:- start:1890 stop:2279 length:390 start_codon:yes stop_codon:yes gene_type:complete